MNEKRKRKLKTFILLLIGSLLISIVCYALTAFLFYFLLNCRNSETNNFEFNFNFDTFISYFTDKKVELVGLIVCLAVVGVLIFQTVKASFFNNSKTVEEYKKTDSNLYGSAKLMNEKEKVKNFGTKSKHPKYYVFHKTNSPLNIKTESTGWVIASKVEGDSLKYLMYTKDTNMLTIGSPGTGKTQFFLMPNIVLNACNSRVQPTMIINDVKGELFSQTSKKLEECGYRILNLNLRNERTSSRFNPFEIIWKYYQSYISILNFRLIDTKGKTIQKSEINLTEHPSNVAVVFNMFELTYGATKDKIKIKFKDAELGIGEVDLSSGEINYQFGVCEIYNVNSSYQIVRKAKNEDENHTKVYTLQIFKPADFLDKTSSEILSLSSTIIPKGSGENQTWNTGSRGIIEGCVWAMLEDSCNPKLNMRLNKFILNNIGNIINGSPKAMVEWLKNRDPKTSKAIKAAAMIIDNTSDKTVSSYISNTQTLLKEYLTSGIAYITSASDFTLDDIVDADQPVALYITIPDENATKYPIATLLIKEIYNYMVFKATKNEGNHLKRVAYFYLDEFAQMPKIDEFKQWINASRSRWIYFNIIIQSVTQLYGTYKQEDGKSIINACAVHLFLGSTDNETVEFFHKELGNETIVTKSSSGSTDTFKKEQMNANYSMTKRELVPINELTEMEQGQAYFKIFRLNPLKTAFVPYFDKKSNEIGLFKKGEADASMEEQMFSEKDSYYDIAGVTNIKSKNSKKPDDTGNDDEDNEEYIEEEFRRNELRRQQSLRNRQLQQDKYKEKAFYQSALSREDAKEKVEGQNHSEEITEYMKALKAKDEERKLNEKLKKQQELTENKNLTKEQPSQAEKNKRKKEQEHEISTAITTSILGALNNPKSATEMAKLMKPSNPK